MPNGRCKVHGGKSTGPRTPEGLERSRRANWKHGHFSREAKAERSRVRAGNACAPLSVHHGTAALTLSKVTPICGATNRWVGENAIRFFIHSATRHLTVSDGGLWMVHSRARGSLLIFNRPPFIVPDNNQRAM